MTDMNANLNMLGTSGAGAETGVGAGAAGGGGLLNSLTQNPELLAIVLDMIGSKMDPESPLAGTGTMLGKSSLAAKAEAGRQAESAKFQDMVGNLIKGITGGKQDGVSNVSISKDDDGVYKYKLDGIERDKDRRIGSLDTTGSEKTIETAEKFAETFGGGL